MAGPFDPDWDAPKVGFGSDSVDWDDWDPPTFDPKNLERFAELPAAIGRAAAEFSDKLALKIIGEGGDASQAKI